MVPGMAFSECFFPFDGSSERKHKDMTWPVSSLLMVYLLIPPFVKGETSGATKRILIKTSPSLCLFI